MATMSKQRRAPRTVMEQAVTELGVLKGARVCVFVCQWTLASQALGRRITIDEYAEWWKESERTAYRHQAEFRRVFGLPTPQAFADHAIVRSEATARGVSGIGALPLDVIATA